MSHEAAREGIREAFGRLTYTHKAHEKAVDRLSGEIKRLKLLQIGLMALTFGGVLQMVIVGEPRLNFLTTIVSAASLVLAIYQLSFNPTQLIADHRKVAKRLWIVREQYLNLIADVEDHALTQEQIRQQRDALARRVGEIYADAVDTTPRDYRAAQKALKSDEEMTFSARDIDAMLPPYSRTAPRALPDRPELRDRE